MDIERLPSIPIVPGRWCHAASDRGLFRVPRPAVRFFDYSLSASAKQAMAALYGDGLGIHAGRTARRPFSKRCPALDAVTYSLTLADFVKVFRGLSGRRPTLEEAWELALIGIRYDGGVLDVLEYAISSAVPRDELTFPASYDDLDD